MLNAVKVSVALSVLSVILIVVILVTVITSKEKNTVKEDNAYYMKSLNNTVVLYKNEDIVKTYDGIVVDTLPITDREQLEQGIRYENIADADLAAEDYDG